MHRNEHPSAPQGLHTDGDPARGIAPTIVPASLMNALQEEIASFVESRGLVLDKNDNTQLAKAIGDLFDKGLKHHVDDKDPHSGYELKINLKRAAYRDVGAGADQVAAGDHSHTGFAAEHHSHEGYELKVNLKQAAYRDVGTGPGTVAAGDHIHPGLGGMRRRALFEGSSNTHDASTVTFFIRDTKMISILVNHGGRGFVQVFADLEQALSVGEVRLYNRGGENADRDYDIVLNISRTQGVEDAARIYIPAQSHVTSIIGYS